jgi:hypothetical protein
MNPEFSQALTNEPERAVTPPHDVLTVADREVLSATAPRTAPDPGSIEYESWFPSTNEGANP